MDWTLKNKSIKWTFQTIYEYFNCLKLTMTKRVVQILRLNGLTLVSMFVFLTLYTSVTFPLNSTQIIKRIELMSGLNNKCNSVKEWNECHTWSLQYLTFLSSKIRFSIWKQKKNNIVDSYYLLQHKVLSPQNVNIRETEITVCSLWPFSI